MKRIIQLSLFLFIFASVSSLAQAQELVFNATVVVKSPEITLAEFQELETLVYKSKDITIPYACLESGIIVFKLYETPYREKGDVRQYLTDVIRKAVEEDRVYKFLDISISAAESVSKC